MRPADPSRRQALLRGLSGFVGTGLAALWQGQSLATRPRETSSIRACIFIFYYGGPSHLDTYDPKPHAPAEVRGEFKTIATSVPGIHVSEHLPRMSQQMHRVALIRSMHHQARLHDSASIHALTGRPLDGPDRELFDPLPQIYPSFGSGVSYARGKAQTGDRPAMFPGGVPSAMLPFRFRNVHPVPCQGAGMLGSAYDPLQIDVDATQGTYSLGALTPQRDVSSTRRRTRQDLLARMNAEHWLAGTAVHQQHALLARATQLFESREVMAALDLSQESPELRARYGYDAPPATVGEGGGGANGAELGYARKMRGQNLLVARRLVEAGVPFVNVYDFQQQGQNWDAHFKCFHQHKEYLLPIADQSLAALIDDLHDRGLLESTLVVATGEFGRTPQINADGGRDHWPDCYTTLLAGGGVTGGAIYGASDRLGAYPAVDPVTPGDLAATLYWRFGIPHDLELRDPLNRPYRLTEGQPLTRLFS